MSNVGFSRTSYNDNLTNSPYNMQGSRLLERVFSFMTYTYLIFMYFDNDINVMPEQEIMGLTQFISGNFDLHVDLSINSRMLYKCSTFKCII